MSSPELDTPASNANAAVADQIWRELQALALAAGLDSDVFGDAQRQVVAQVAAEINRPVPQPPQPARRLFRRRSMAPPPTTPTSPIILCGPPGTGKTTFLYLLDTVLRSAMRLPDNIKPQMQRPPARTLAVRKRTFNGYPLSLLSVRQWTDLLHFYHWDTVTHGLVKSDLTRFIQTTLKPMRVLFADEIEMIGYAPTIPYLVNEGVLLIGTSNQAAFPQLDRRLLAPHTFAVNGADLRAGAPEDALLQQNELAMRLMAEVGNRPVQQWQRLSYRTADHGPLTLCLLDFATAVHAPLLEIDWGNFLAELRHSSATAYRPLLLLLDDVSLATLAENFDAVIRFVILFDVIEQLGVGVRLRLAPDAAEITHATLNSLREDILARVEVPAEIRTKTAVGIGRTASRLGAAASRAANMLAGVAHVVS